MGKLPVDQFVDLVKRSGLVDDARLNQALSGVDQSVKDSGIIAAVLTKAGLITEWHSEKLLQGRHKGFHLGKFKLLNHLGAGGMGAVYLAEHRVMHHRVAIKVLPQSFAKQPSYLERFHQEARALVRVNHPNIVRATDVDEDGETHFLVMEYVEGADLQAIVSRSGPLPYETAARYAKQAAEGLDCAHRAGLIHRDIKPANLLVDKAGVVKILDMGLARLTDDTQASLTREYDQKMIGTVDYLAPEQAIDSHKVDARADIYSLGCTLYFMLTGDPPFPTGTLAQRVLQHQTAEPTDIRSTRPDAPAELVEICRKMMAKTTADRFQSGEEVAQALGDFLGDVSEATVIRSAPPTGPSLNENLTLAPLDDEPGNRGTRQVPPSEAKASGIGSSAGKKPDSGLKKGAGSSVRSGDSGAGRTGAMPPSAIKPPSGVKSPSGVKPPSGIKQPAPKPLGLGNPDDPMDELLSAPAIISSEPPLIGSPLHTHAHHNNQVMRSMGKLLAIGLGAAALVVGFIFWCIWYFAY